jgi:hypothetical protein
MSSPFTTSILGGANNYSSLYNTVVLPYGKMYNNCSNTLCFTYSKNFIYKPHSNYGNVGTTSAGSRAQKRRL